MVEVICCCIVHKECSILQDVNADERAVFVVTHVDQSMLSNLFGSFNIPPYFHGNTKPARCIETAVAPGDGARVALHEMSE